MSLPGSPSVTPFILSQGEKGGGFNICLYLALPLSLHSSYRKVRRGGGGFNICLYLASPLSREKGGGCFNICLYLVLPLSLHSSYRMVKKRGVVLTYVSTWLCLCHSISSYRKVRRGGVLTYVSSWLCLCHSIHLMAR